MARMGRGAALEDALIPFVCQSRLLAVQGDSFRSPCLPSKPAETCDGVVTMLHVTARGYPPANESHLGKVYCTVY